MTAAGDRSMRVVIDGADRPALQIARDLAVLMGERGPTLRFYGWHPTGLSLGRFQKAAAFDWITAVHETARRPTGGGAIWHAEEITFALVAPDDPAQPAEAWYARVHDRIVATLADHGVRAARMTAGPAHPGPRAQDTPWCFATATRGDIVTEDGAKLCGSAMRRVRAPVPRLLLHGSLILEHPAVGPRCAAVADQVDPGPIRAALCDSLARGLAAEFGWEPDLAELEANEELQANALVDEVAM